MMPCLGTWGSSGHLSFSHLHLGLCCPPPDHPHQNLTRWPSSGPGHLQGLLAALGMQGAEAAACAQAPPQPCPQGVEVGPTLIMRFLAPQLSGHRSLGAAFLPEEGPATPAPGPRGPALQALPALAAPPPPHHPLATTSAWTAGLGFPTGARRLTLASAEVCPGPCGPSATHTHAHAQHAAAPPCDTHIPHTRCPRMHMGTHRNHAPDTSLHVSYTGRTGGSVPRQEEVGWVYRVVQTGHQWQPGQHVAGGRVRGRMEFSRPLDTGPSVGERAAASALSAPHCRRRAWQCRHAAQGSQPRLVLFLDPLETAGTDHGCGRRPPGRGQVAENPCLGFPLVPGRKDGAGGSCIPRPSSPASPLPDPALPYREGSCPW